MKGILIIPVLIFSLDLASQDQDSADNARLAQMIQLSEVVVRNNLDINGFIERVKKDTSFYKAFRNLRILSFSSMNDIRMLDKNGRTEASLMGKTSQQVSNGCRTMQVVQENTTGDFYKKDGSYNYYTAEVYASLFFTNGKACGENNIVNGLQHDVRSKKGIEKHKEQLKMLFFDPGKRIPAIPFMGDKTAIFERDNMEKYAYSIDYVDFNGENCYRFEIVAKEGADVVIDNMTTWFSSRDMVIVARNYDLSYKAGVYDFDVRMEVQMTQFGELMVPSTLRYSGNWDVAFQKKERGLFTATLFDFKK